MIFRETILKGAYIIEPERREDSRGFFARLWCRKEFLAEGLNGQLAQSNISYTKAKGTLRGMHYQAAPFGEIKLVRCTMGAIYDVIIDLRPESPTYLQWIAEELTAENRKILYVPKNFAHGFQSLVDDTEVFYQVSEFYVPDAERGVRYDDPIFKITWPLDVGLISDKDRGWPDYRP
jgi:dTDP-4-dehydrorhamnose 3,5-epimerase